MSRTSALRVCIALFLSNAACTRAKETDADRPKPTEAAPAPPPPAPVEPLDAQQIGERLGVAMVAATGGALRATLPRDDLRVSVSAAPAPRGAELGTFVELRPSPAGAALAGRVTLLADEVDAVIDTLLAHGISVLGLHNRFAFDEPRVLLLHFGAEGSPLPLASGVQSIGAAIRDARLRSPEPPRSWPGPAPAAGALDAVAIGGVLGGPAQALEGEVALSVPRRRNGAEAAAPGDTILVSAWMGSDVLAAVEGTLTLTFEELAPALSGLRRGNLHLTALHPEPAISANAALPTGQGRFHAYFYGKGTSLDLVVALRRVLEPQLEPAPSATRAD